MYFEVLSNYEVIWLLRSYQSVFYRPALPRDFFCCCLSCSPLTSASCSCVHVAAVIDLRVVPVWLRNELGAAARAFGNTWGSRGLCRFVGFWDNVFHVIEYEKFFCFFVGDLHTDSIANTTQYYYRTCVVVTIASLGLDSVISCVILLTLPSLLARAYRVMS